MSEKQETGEGKPLPCAKIVRGQERLTPEQEVYAREFAQKRIAAMLSTEAIDEAVAEEHLRQAYRMAGRESPSIRWFDSPIAFVRASVRSGSMEGDVWVDVGVCVVASVMASVWTSVGDRVEDRMWTGVMASVGASVGNRVVENVWTSVEESVWAGVEPGMWAGVSNGGINVADNVDDSVRSYIDERPLACYQFFHEMFEANHLISLALFNEMVSGYRLGNQEAWVVRKPIRLERDEQGRLHSADGMCVQYRDGWGFYAWHGVRVAGGIILHPEQISREDWLHERNLEVRRAIAERLGTDRFVELVGATCIDQGQRGTLVEVDLGDDPERVARYVHIQESSTERKHYLRVPSTIQSADEAVAWTSGLNAQEDQPPQEA